MKTSSQHLVLVKKMLLVGGVLSALASWIAPTAVAGAWSNRDAPTIFNQSFNTDDQGRRASYQYTLSELPLSGELAAEKTPWSDSYWPKQRGAFSYRWRQFQSENENPTMSVAERSEKFFVNYHFYSKDELKHMTVDQIAMLSPMEKYDIFRGDYRYNLTKKYLFGKGNGPDRLSWEGYCHAWAPAASHYAEPMPNLVVSDDGIPVSFGSGDVKALLIANYHESMFPGVFSVFADKTKRAYIGGKGCPTNVNFLYPTTKFKNGLEEMAEYGNTDGVLDSELENKVREYQEGLKRVLATNPNSVTLPFNAKEIANDPNLPAKARAAASQPECMGVNAGTFHLVMANQLGIMHTGFELDKTRDGQIWNQPVRGFHSEILGYEAPTAHSTANTEKVAIVKTDFEFAEDADYGWAFWYPTLTNLFKVDNDFLAEYAHYMKMLINIGDETEMKTYPYDIIDTVHYQYKLDLDHDGKIIGGEWITLERPDTLWIMEKRGFEGNFKSLSKIYKPVSFK